MSSDVTFFRNIEIPPAHDYRIEHLGTKEKFWIELPDFGQCLIKFPRPNSGEDWAEKIAAELAGRLGLPHAEYELATMNGRHATLTSNFLSGQASLIHGNELLVESHPEYGRNVSRYRMSAHTLDAVIGALSTRCEALPIGWQRPADITSPCEVFVGYLLLDAWIGNTDRHHENWGVIRDMGVEGRERIYLAPTFDHASSLGCREPDSKKRQRLSTSDSRFSVDAYCQKARSAFYGSAADSKPLGTLEVFGRAALAFKKSASFWVTALDGIPDEDVVKLMERIPHNRISPDSRRFATAMLAVNRNRLRGVLDHLK